MPNNLNDQYQVVWSGALRKHEVTAEFNEARNNAAYSAQDQKTIEYEWSARAKTALAEGCTLYNSRIF